MNGGQWAQKTASAGPAEHFDLFTDDGRPAGRERPAALLEPRPQPGVQRHTLECAVEVCPFVQILNVLVPQVGDLVLDFLQKIDAPALGELVIVSSSAQGRTVGGSANDGFLVLAAADHV